MMSSHLPHAPSISSSIPPPQSLSNIIFDQALQEHLKLLDSSEIKDFATAQPEDVLSAVSDYHSAHENSRLRRCIKRICKVIKPLEQFFGAVDNGVSSLPEVAGIVWGALRFVMQGIRSLSAYFDKIGEILEEIAEDLPHYQDYAAELFSDSRRVMEGLAGVYGDILLTCTTVRRIYQNPKGTRSSISITGRGLNPWDRALDDIIDSLRQRRERLNSRVRHEDMRIAHGQRRTAQRQRENDEQERERKREEKVQRRLREEAEARERLREEAEARERDMLRQLDQRKKEFLEVLEKSAYADCHSKHEACRSVLSQHLDAGRWLLDRPVFQNWANSSSGMLWLRGKAGAGKTILASIVVKYISSQFDGAPKQRNIAYFYCQYDDSQKRSDPRIVLGTLLHQVISQLPSDDPHMPTFGPSGSPPPDYDTLLAMLSSISKNSKNIVLVVDALDEFDDNRRRKLLQALKRLSRDAKVFFTSRDLMPSQVQDDTGDLLRDVQVITADPESINKDIIKVATQSPESGPA
ncbi:hypothetical protein FA95DRAFT_315597 [Auriscalpium vulgare]|uniref:Uncharacterized protein n=1 Tax=Auriscalpium vulgare TaxID=40419 RepID=A0ACB8S4D9_9AGAM|nr:hypothetical protein FA95DRAFT_315597 [Auriscalpium vulgare]